jgi:multiple sugar transport system substrate-binding protein
MEQLVEAYEAENEDVSIEIQLTPYKGSEYWTKLEAAATGGTAPDVFWLNVLHLDSYVEGGILADLTDAISASDINDAFPEALVQNYVRDGVNYAVPKDFDTNALWYNKEIFDKAGVAYPTDDMTYEDLVALAQELQDAGLDDGVYPFACPVDFQTWYYQTVYANGGYIINDDKTESGYDDPKTQEGIQCWIDMIDAGLSPSAAALAETSADAMFEGGQLAMNFAGSYMVPEYAENDAIADIIDCVEIPTFNGIEDNCINGLGYAVYEGSKNKDAAIDFAIWLGSEEAMKIQGETGVVISARTDAQEYFAQANEAYNLAAYTNHADIAYPLPVCKSAAELYDMEATALQKAYNGEESLADVCAELKTEADALLANDAK